MKSETVIVMMSPELKAVLVAICDLEKRTMSEVVRDLIREKAKEYDLWPPYLTRQHPASELIDSGVEYTVEQETK